VVSATVLAILAPPGIVKVVGLVIDWPRFAELTTIIFTPPWPPPECRTVPDARVPPACNDNFQNLLLTIKEKDFFT
jgi:hypothetical protein